MYKLDCYITCIITYDKSVNLHSVITASCSSVLRIRVLHTGRNKFLEDLLLPVKDWAP